MAMDPRVSGPIAIHRVLVTAKDRTTVNAVIAGVKLDESDEWLQPSIIEETDEKGATCLHWAVWKNNPDSFKLIMERKPELARIRTDVGQTPLMWLCLRGEVENTLPFFKALYDAYPQAIHEKDTHGLTPLHLAVQSNNLLGAAFLCMQGVDINATDNEGASPACWAAFVGKLNMLYFLGGQNADMLASDNHGMNPLHRAARQGHEAAVTFLLDAHLNRFGFNIEQECAEGLSPYQLAEEMGKADVLKKIKQARKGPPITDVRTYRYNARIFYISGVLVSFALWWWYLFPTTMDTLWRLQQVSIVLLVIWVANWIALTFTPPGLASTYANKHRLKQKILSGDPFLRSDNICPTCMIEKPVRSKHDAITDKCYYRFDHFCTWIGDAVAEDNYGRFFWHITIQAIGHAIFLYMCYNAYVTKTVFDGALMSFLFLSSVAVQLFGLYFAGSLAYQHWDFASANYTTNEYTNRDKYEHFKLPKEKNDKQKYRSPFDRGVMYNLKMMLIRSHRRRVYHLDGRVSYL